MAPGPSHTPAAFVEAIFALFHSHGASDYIGEAVSSLEHALQAAQCAREAAQPDAVIAGALLHDVGHMLGLIEPDMYERMGDCGVVAHEGIGAAFLENHSLPATTCNIVRGHVSAKRYLTWRDPTYYDRLSPASKTTLGYQGGPMNDEEAHAFELDPLHDTILQMRTWDERAKVPALVVPDLESYRAMLEGA